MRLVDSGPDRLFEMHEIEGAGWSARVGLRPGRGGGMARRPLLLFNGFGTPMTALATFVSALGDGPLIVIDAPGVGTRVPRMPYALAGLAYQVDRWLDAHGAGARTVDVMGVSWGGCVAQQFAHQYPARCARLVLAATSPGVVMVPGRTDALLGLWLGAPSEPASTARHVGGASASPGLGPPSAGGGLFARLFQLMALAGWSSLPWLPQLRQPTLVLAGARDTLVPAANAALLRALIRDASLEILPGGHDFLVRNGAGCAARVRQFLEEGALPSPA